MSEPGPDQPGTGPGADPHAGVPDGPAARRGRTVVLLIAVLGAAVLGSLAWINADAPGTHPANLIHPGADGPSAAAIASDFPGEVLPPGLGHDGQQFYAVARSPFDLDAAAENLDRPRYRLQRMAFPLLAWALHPSGGGTGLVAAFLVVGVVAVAVGSFAAGRLSQRLGGGPGPALVYLLAPGTWMALRFSLADNVALAAAMAALLLSISGRHRWAVAAAILAVLAKESLLLLPLGLALAYRDRARIALVAAPAAVAAGWWLALHGLVADDSEGVVEFTYPFGGLVDSARYWAEGNAPVAMLVVPTTLLYGALVLARTRRCHPLWPALALQLAFVPLLGIDVLGLDANGPRMTLPLLILAALTAATPNAMVAPADPANPAGLTAPNAVTGPASAPAGGP